MLTMAAVIPVTGWFLQRVTTRRRYAIAMGVFLAGTAICRRSRRVRGAAARPVVQAGGTAVMMPLLMTTLMTVVPEQDRGRVMGNVTLAISVAPALGPAVSGVVLQLGSWRCCSLLVLPIARVDHLARPASAGEHRRDHRPARSTGSAWSWPPSASAGWSTA